MGIRDQLLVATCVGALSACAPSSSSVAVASRCATNTRAVWTSDSLMSLCAPADFISGQTGGWGRPGVGTSFVDFLSIKFLSWPRDSASMGRWPPHIASGTTCLADCSSADEVAVHRDTIAGFQAVVETGLSSGGIQGWRRQPVLVVSWILNDSVRAYGFAWARGPDTIDTLRTLLHTIRLGARPS